MTHEPLPDTAVLTASEVARRPRDPDPLNPADVSDAYEQGWADGHVSAKVIEAARARRRETFSGIVILAAAVALLVIGYLVGVASARAAPRSAPESSVPAQARSGAPPPAIPAAPAKGTVLTRPDASGNLASGAPSPGPELGTAIEGGIASYVARSFGDHYLALPEGPGHRVRICSSTTGRCVERTSTDAGPDLAMQRAGRVADLSFADFAFLCRCDPPVLGVIPVSVERGGGPGPTPPPTDTDIQPVDPRLTSITEEGR